jgi:hypothetical protein
MIVYEMRLRLLLHADPEHFALIVERLFDLMDEAQLAEDISAAEPDGRFNLWLTVTAEDPRQALAQALDAVIKFEAVAAAALREWRPCTFLGVEIAPVREPAQPEPLLPAAG